MNNRTELRFWSKAFLGDGCWLWDGPLWSGGYARFWVEGHSVRAHRFAYELRHEPVDRSLTVDHMCHTDACRLGELCPHRRCVNPDHLQAIPLRDNLMRSHTPAGINAAKTHCLRGHPLFGENLYLNHNKRFCRACRKATDGIYRRPYVSRGTPMNARTHCPQGHEYTPENTYVNQGRRNCRICRAASSRARKAAAKAARQVTKAEHSDSPATSSGVN